MLPLVSAVVALPLGSAAWCCHSMLRLCDAAAWTRAAVLHVNQCIVPACPADLRGAD